jgi:hypothetical protein
MQSAARFCVIGTATLGTHVLLTSGSSDWGLLPTNKRSREKRRSVSFKSAQTRGAQPPTAVAEEHGCRGPMFPVWQRAGPRVEHHVQSLSGQDERVQAALPKTPQEAAHVTTYELISLTSRSGKESSMIPIS